MGIFDTIGSWLAPNIAGPEISGLQQGYNLASPQLTAGSQNVNQLISGQAIPYLQQTAAQAQPYLQNVYQTGQQGVDQLMQLLGLGGGGAQGAQAALSATPGYQFTKQQGQGAIDAAAAASGNLNSGGLIKSLADYTSGLASQTYQGAVNNLAPFTQMFQGGANQLGNLFTGLGSNVAGLYQGQAAQQSPFYQNLASLGWNLGAGTGAANAQQGVLDASLGSNLFGNLLNFGGKALSDVRLKEKIEKVGELYDGLGVFKFVYKGDDTPRLGVMAQEVERRVPEAVTTHPSGFKMVDYAKATRPAAALAYLMAA